MGGIILDFELNSRADGNLKFKILKFKISAGGLF